MRNTLTVNPTTPDKYYVYGLFTPNGVPFYIGKGKDRRINEHFRNYRLKEDNYKNRVIKKYGVSAIKREILCYFDSEGSAYDFEEYLISVYKLKNDGGCLTNILRHNKDYPKVSQEVNLKKGVASIKYPEPTIVEVYKLYFTDCIRALQIAKQLGMSAHTVADLVKGESRKDLYSKYIISGQIVNNSGIKAKSLRGSFENVKDSQLLEVYPLFCVDGVYQNLADDLGCSVSWLKQVFCGAKRSHLNFNIKADRVAPYPRRRKEVKPLDSSSNSENK